MAPNSGFRFFDLPAELRINILSQVLVSDCGIVLHTCTTFGLSRYDIVIVLYIFLVNVQMYQEASAIFYGQNRFILNAQTHRLPVHLTKPGGFLSQQGQDARRRVQTLYLYLSRIGGEFEDILAPAISDMILSGSLRKLKIYLGPPSLHNSRMSGADMMTRRPFQALLKLLADPDLQHVELGVWKHHWAVFCPFHKEWEMPTKGNTPTELVDEHGLATIRGISDWIQLDWEKMVNVLGTSERIVKIRESIL
ncbi:hypothetical protein HD806DRAFT_46789 [Xylariaceae sp. AK1471]|nr:hypothetical protein HD806DRAFT_46789 [Xylariaceae sp. AK1471]